MKRPIVVEHVLDHERDWDEKGAYWRLPAPLSRCASDVALAIDGQDVPAEQVELRQGRVYWKGDAPPCADNSLVAHLTLCASRPPWLIGVVACLLVAAAASLTTWLLVPRLEAAPSQQAGQPLAARDFYPVVADEDGRLRLDKERFMQGVRVLLEENDPQAAGELIYLGQSNNVSLLLNDQERKDYGRLTRKYSLPHRGLDERRQQLFDCARRIVDGVGETFSGTGIEIVLHDTSNPLHSIQAVKNPISGRQLNDPTTNFGVELIRHYAQVKGGPAASFISYPLTLKDKRRIKSTTIPLYDERLGLYGFVCMNIDTSKLSTDELTPETKRFLEAFCMTRDSPEVKEIIENSAHHKASTTRGGKP
jgi:predicted transcriptional regulator YheO